MQLTKFIYMILNNFINRIDNKAAIKIRFSKVIFHIDELDESLLPQDPNGTSSISIESRDIKV